jgi:galactoside O-acetyltransferase
MGRDLALRLPRRVRAVVRRLPLAIWCLRGVRAAPSARIHRRVVIYGARGLSMAAGAGIGHGAMVKCVPGTLRMGERSWLGEGSWVSCTESVVIERDAMIGPGCHITDANHGIAGLSPIKAQPRVASPVVIGEGAWLAAGVKVLAGVRVGRGAVVAAGAVVTKDVPDYAIVGGVPARMLGSRSPNG